MKTERVLKERVLRSIEKLPENHLREVRDFVNHLLKKKRRAARKSEPDPKNDPILELIGIADVEPFAHKIDSELYGD